MNYSDKLRAFADYIDAHPVLAGRLGKYDHPTVYLYADDWSDFQTLIADLDGYDKDGYGGSLTATHQELSDSDITFKACVTVSGVCEKVPKLDEDGAPVMVPKRTTVLSDELEPVYDWQCPKVWSA